MKKWFYLLIIFAACSSVWADDAADQAEAQSRGVSVDTIQAEHARTKNELLKARVKELQDQLKARPASPANPALIESLNKQINAEVLKIPEVPAHGAAEVIAPPRPITVGMSFDDAKKVFLSPAKPPGVKESVETSWQLQSSDADGEDYFCVNEDNDTARGTKKTAILARVHVRNGKITNCMISEGNIQLWKQVIDSYKPAAAPVGPSYGPASKTKLSTPTPGMTLDQVLATLAYTTPPDFPYTLYVDWQKQSSDVRGDRYVCTWGIAKVNAGSAATRFPPQGQIASVLIKNGKVTQMGLESMELSRYQSVVDLIDPR